MARKFVVLDNVAAAEDISMKSVAADIQEIIEKPKYHRPAFVTLDFGKRPDLLDAVRSLADAQFRTVDQQILFILNEFCEDFIIDNIKKK